MWVVFRATECVRLRIWIESLRKSVPAEPPGLPRSGGSKPWPPGQSQLTVCFHVALGLRMVFTLEVVSKKKLKGSKLYHDV